MGELYCKCGEYLTVLLECKDPEFGCGFSFKCNNTIIHSHLTNFYNIKKCPCCRRVDLDAFLESINWKMKNPRYWKEIFLRTNTDLFLTSWEQIRGYKNLVSYIKSIRYSKRRLRQVKMVDPGFDYPDYKNELEDALRNMSRGLDYVDNLRWAKAGDRKQVKRYYKAQRNGCCGYIDKVLKIKGQDFMIGCNYGH